MYSRVSQLPRWTSAAVYHPDCRHLDNSHATLAHLFCMLIQARIEAMERERRAERRNHEEALSRAAEAAAQRERRVVEEAAGCAACAAVSELYAVIIGI